MKKKNGMKRYNTGKYKTPHELGYNETSCKFIRDIFCYLTNPYVRKREQFSSLTRDTFLSATVKGELRCFYGAENVPDHLFGRESTSEFLLM
jgi:hypothetical protein